jgi:hypothetical protein
VANASASNLPPKLDGEQKHRFTHFVETWSARERLEHPGSATLSIENLNGRHWQDELATPAADTLE